MGSFMIFLFFLKPYSDFYTQLEKFTNVLTRHICIFLSINERIKINKIFYYSKVEIKKFTLIIINKNNDKVRSKKRTLSSRNS